MLRSELYDKGLLKVANKELIAIGDNLLRYTIVSNDIPNKSINELINISVFNER
jgi:hypothetical protein